MADKTTPKVVPLKNFMQPSAGVRLLQECSRIATEDLGRSLSAMLGQVDDALFELAEKAENNLVQNTYFDAMREVRLKRKDMEAAFQQRFEEDIRQAIEEASTGARDIPAGGLELSGELTLVEDNHLETDLAVTNMVSKALNGCKEELFALDTRVGLLLNKPGLKDEDNPFHPLLICRAFKEACEVLEADIKVKLIILKLFERFVVPDLREIYRRINEHLAQNDVLPRIQYAIQQRGGDPEAPGDQAGGAGAGNTGGIPGGVPGGMADPFAALQQVVVQYQHARAIPGAAGGGTGSGVGGGTGSDLGGGIPAQGPAAPPGFPAGAGGSMSGVIGYLTELQHGAVAMAGAGSGGTLPDIGAGNILYRLKEQGVFGALPQGEDRTIDVVAMLFDYILEDKAIPERMKALIGRLQIPILKVVMLDKDFFRSKNHPARKFLDTLSQAAVGIEDETEAEAVYGLAERLVQRILNEYEDDVSLFGEVLAELEAHLEEAAQRAAEAEARLREEAAAQERQERARLKAAEAVRQRLQEHEGLDETLRDFLDHHWKTLLMMTFLMEGEESDAWLTAVNTMDRLIWSIAPKKSAEERKRLVETLPALLNDLRQGMSLIELPEAEQEAFFNRLARRHSEAVSARQRRDRDASESNSASGRDSDSNGGETAGGASTHAARMPEDALAEGDAMPQDPHPKPDAEPDSAPDSEMAANLEDGCTVHCEGPAPAAEAQMQEDDPQADAPRANDGEDAWHDGIDPATAAAFQREDLQESPEADSTEALGEEALQAPQKPAVCSPLEVLKRYSSTRASELLAEIEAGIRTGDVEVEEITMGEDGTTVHNEEQEDEFTRLVQDMENGTWIAFRQANGKVSQEKLTWINSITGIYMFTNRNGKNTRNLTFYQFAEALRKGEAEVIAEAPLVDRAMNSLMNGLHKH